MHLLVRRTLADGLRQFTDLLGQPGNGRGHAPGTITFAVRALDEVLQFPDVHDPTVEGEASAGECVLDQLIDDTDLLLTRGPHLHFAVSTDDGEEREPVHSICRGGVHFG